MALLLPHYNILANQTKLNPPICTHMKMSQTCDGVHIRSPWFKAPTFEDMVLYVGDLSVGIQFDTKIVDDDVLVCINEQTCHKSIGQFTRWARG